MNPEKQVEDQDYPKASKSDLSHYKSLYQDSRSFRQSSLEPRWSKNARLMKGVPLEDSNTKSKVTGRNKIYFRKIWSTAWRLLASFYQSFLSDKSRFRIVGRDDVNDWAKAKVLEFMTKYHFERLLRRRSAFLKLLWAFMDCISPGLSVIKLFWRYNEELGIDEPDFTVYPQEQVCLDWQADSPDLMQFVGFENYLTKNEMEEMGYKNIGKAKAVMVPQSVLRHARYANAQDPAKPASEGDYTNGTVGANFPESPDDTSQLDHPLNRYLVVEMFCRKKGKIVFCAFDPNADVYMVDPMPNPFGDMYPVAVGSMLLEAHKLVPEGLPEVLEGPQEALNMDLNLRKDNVRLAMSGGFIYGKYGQVDKQALRNIFPGFTVGAADVAQVAPIKIPDVTQNAHIEIAQDMSMLEEMSGVNDTALGQSRTGKTGEAQINFQQAMQKLDLNTAIVGQTLFHQFIYILARMIQMFETDEQVFRVANAKLKDMKDPRAAGVKENIYDLDFDADLETEVGFSEVSRSAHAQRAVGFLQIMNQSNAAMLQAMASGVKIENPKIWNTGEAALEFAPEFGITNPSRFLVSVAPPPPEQPAAGGGESAQEAAGAPAQPNEAPPPPEGFDQFLASLGG